MKKIFYLMTTVIVTLAFNACTVNDNPATPENTSGRAVITFNTAAIYEEMGIVERIERNFSNNLSISDSVLIYDQNGHLVKKLGTVTRDLEPQTIVADDLPNGTYTLVAWQNGYFDDGTSVAKPYVLADEDELATVKLLQTEWGIPYVFANGIAHATVVVDGNTLETTVTPKFVGSLVNLKSEDDFQDYGYDEIGVYRLDQTCRGFYLDPARTGDDRWIMEYVENMAYPIAFLVQDEMEYLHYTLEHGDDMLLSVVAWRSSGDVDVPDVIVGLSHHKLQDASNMVYYFDLSRFSFQPPFFGPADELPAWKADRDTGLLVNDPYLKWGCNLDEVEQHKKAKQFWADAIFQPEFWEGKGWHWWYWVAPALTEQYIFETEDCQNLISALSICHDENVPVDIFFKSLQLQGYTYLGKLYDVESESYDDMFLSADGQTEVKVSENDYGGWVIDYCALVSEDLNNVIPADLAPASRKQFRIAPNTRRSSTSSETKFNRIYSPVRQRY